MTFGRLGGGWWERQIDLGQRQGEEKKKRGIMKWSRLFLNPGNLSRHGLHMGGLGGLLLKESHCLWAVGEKDKENDREGGREVKEEEERKKKML